ncbi:MAG: Acyl-CoA thioesterase YbgC [Syntrophomonadaceae bacterium]|nr:Acyl-CoA thioesterase YbgC [Bacillota bacterium]
MLSVFFPFCILYFTKFQWSKRGIQFVVVNAEIDFKSQAKLGEIIKVNTQISDMLGATIVFDYIITEKLTRRTIVAGRTRMACTNEQLKPMRIPKEIIDKLTSGEQYRSRAVEQKYDSNEVTSDKRQVTSDGVSG